MELFIDSDPNLLKTVPTLDDIIQLRTYNTEAILLSIMVRMLSHLSFVI